MNKIDDFIRRAIEEDMPNGDITTDNLINEKHFSKARFIAKEDGILSGMQYVRRVFELIGGQFDLEGFKNDGEEVKKGEIIASITGATRTLLKGERLALNIMQRLSGIATNTNKFVKNAKNAKILDTRKTTPNFRYFERQAVVDGGGVNHRYCLSDQVLIKDNHIEAVGSIKNAVSRVYGKVNCLIEVEVENINMFLEALDTNCDIIMLDNMNNEDMAYCVKLNQGRKKLEASGNMTLERIFEVDKTGVDFISIGALTHSSKALDISLKFYK